MSLAEEAERLSRPGFDVVFRAKTMDKTLLDDRGYERCHATPFFWAYIMASGDVYGCSAYLED